MITAIALLLAAAAIHRIWNYEDIFAPVRRLQWVAAFPPLSCPACNPIWIAALVAAAAQLGGVLTVTQAVIFTFAAYLPLRALVWVYQQNWASWFMVPMLLQRGLNAWQAQLPAPAKATPAAPSLPAPKDAAGCSSCAQKKDAILAERKRTDAFPRRFVVVGEDAAHWASVIKLAHPSALVQIWGSVASAATPAGVEYRALLPANAPSAQVAKALVNGLIWLGNATVVTDGWLEDEQLSAAAAEAGRVRAFSWVHLHGDDPRAVVAVPEHHRSARRTSENLLAAIALAQPVPGPTSPTPAAAG